MRVCYDISPALEQGGGISRYTQELALALHALEQGPKLTLFHHGQPLESLPETLATLPRLEAPVKARTWQALLLAGRQLPQAWEGTLATCDLFHGPNMLAPPISQPIVITVHDLSPVTDHESNGLLARLHINWSLTSVVPRATAIIAVSEATKKELIARFPSAAAKIYVVPNGVDHKRFFPRYRPEARQRAGLMLGIEPPYMLALGSAEPRKNLATLLRAYARLGRSAPKLVLVGARVWEEGPLFDLIQELGLQKRVRFTGYVPEAILADLYAGARLFIYPSHYEGFGLPVLEALACGAPVITSNISSLPEVAGDAALLADPHNVEALADIIDKALNDKKLRDDLRIRGPRQAARFTWERTAQQTLAVYAAAQNPHPSPA